MMASPMNLSMRAVVAHDDLGHQAEAAAQDAEHHVGRIRGRDRREAAQVGKEDGRLAGANNRCPRSAASGAARPFSTSSTRRTPSPVERRALRLGHDVLDEAQRVAQQGVGHEYCRRYVARAHPSVGKSAQRAPQRDPGDPIP